MRYCTFPKPTVFIDNWARPVQEAFAAFDSGKGRVDILEVFAAMSLASDVSRTELRDPFAAHTASLTKLPHLLAGVA